LTRIFIVICCFLGVQNTEPIITWSDSYKLTWDDFKGEPKENSTAAAITSSGIGFEYSIKQNIFSVVSFKTKVLACFYPEKSWYKPQLANTHILAHEQLHYDITELYARKFRQQLSRLKLSKILKSELDALQESINRQLENRQHEYDTDTDFSRSPEVQEQWQELIKGELKKLTAFKSQ
jgi:hypothetical protein